MSFRIIGAGRGLPSHTLTNAQLSEMVDTSNEWILSRTGIETRQICTTESMTDLCERAALSALKSAKLQASDIDLVICSTINGDFVTPSLSCTLAERLGTSCPAFDINAACAGFIYTLDCADSYITCGKAENILIVSCEMMSKHIDWTCRSLCVLFGDGAGACVLTKGNALKYIKTLAKPGLSLLNLPSGNGTTPFAERRTRGQLHMDGQEVFKFAVSTIATELDKAFNALNISPEDIDYFLVHQANKRIIDSARTRLGLPQEKFPLSIMRYGNMSSATIPVLMSEMLEDGRINPGSRLLMCAFGAGLTFGTAAMTWE